jgi:hypothetical protein
LFLLAKEQIERFAEPDASIDRTDLDWVAEAFSALRLYLEAVRFGHSDDDSLLQSTCTARTKLLGASIGGRGPASNRLWRTTGVVWKRV